MKETTKQNLLRIVCKHVSTSVCNRLQQLVQYMSLRARSKQEKRRFILKQINRITKTSLALRERVPERSVGILDESLRGF